MENSLHNAAIYEEQDGGNAATAQTYMPNGIWSEMHHQTPLEEALDFENQGLHMLIVFMMQVAFQVSIPGLVQEGIKG